MKVALFRGAGRVFAVIAADSATALPQHYGPWTEFKTLELLRGQTQPGLDVEECLDDLEAHGIHVTDAHQRITDKIVP